MYGQRSIISEKIGTQDSEMGNIGVEKKVVYPWLQGIKPK